MADTLPPISVGLMGTVSTLFPFCATKLMPCQGEYTTGITPSGQSKSDKKVSIDSLQAQFIVLIGPDRCRRCDHVRSASSRQGQRVSEEM